MDWDSPTTKKHIEEARAQGCELLGPGDKNDYRTYRLGCGHEQIVQVKQMRSGGYRCRRCLELDMQSEAEAQGCVLLGPGRSKFYRLYRLPCGHEQESQRSIIRKGEFACQTCFTDKLKAEAEARGCVLLSDRPRREAGIKHNSSRNYRLQCGHEQRMQPGAMRVGRFRCQTCLNENLKAEALSENCELIGPGQSAYYRLYRLPCGHEQEIGTPDMRNGEYTCQTCLKQKHQAEARARGCELLGKGKHFLYRTYRLPCGHEQEITLQHMRLGSFRCQSCEEYFYTLPSNAYLLHIKVSGEEWLKLGYAKDLDFRISRYKLPHDAEINQLAVLPFATGKEAHEFENALHKKYRRKRLSPGEMTNFHTSSGATECYPVTMVDRLLAEFKPLK